ncbi:hypothetical protein DTO164E3_5006 [Paecilomyces variotii]|nr:hypothetical protein DTO164E3_5006 [Paecilomyces variotii]KAJ9242116.1 hypothetical protein DTO169E5_3337 [Paecilomyces variotii]KAJ9410438.1 hypothetical protein DTO045G8_1901 [Paecilomyces variotii]
MPPLRSVYAGGYNEGIRRQLDNIVLPDKVKCETCKKIRMQSAFSKRQLDVLRNAMVQLGATALSGPGYAKCRTCVGNQTVEMTCSSCDKVKGLDEFAKAQRHNPDTARCLNCVQNHLEAEPVLEETRLRKENDIESTTGTSQYDDGTTRRSFKDFSVGDEDSIFNYAPSVAFTEDEDDASVGGGVWVEPERQDDNSNANDGRPFTAYDSKGIPHRRMGSQPQAAKPGFPRGGISGGIATTESGDFHAPRARPQQKKSRGFAKISGPRFKPGEAPTMRIPESNGKMIAESDDEEGLDPQDYL